MSNEEALTTVLKMAENLYNKDMLNHILHNDLEIKSHQRDALVHVDDYILDLEQYDALKQMQTSVWDSDFKTKED